MATYIQNLLNNALGDGARATKFDCDIVFTNSKLFDGSADHVRTLVKATSFPGKSHDIIDFKYKGRSIPMKGQVKYNQTWTCTFYLTEDHKLKNSFETWIEALDQQHNYHRRPDMIPNLIDTQKTHFSAGYNRTIHIFQRNFDNTQITAQYWLVNAFPIEVSAVEYSAESLGQIQEFTVTFAYSHYEMNVVKGSEGNFIDEFIDNALAKFSGVVDSAMGSLTDLADDAVGAAAAQLSALTDNLISGFSGSTETASKTSEQIAKSADTMITTLDDIVKSEG